MQGSHAVAACHRPRGPGRAAPDPRDPTQPRAQATRFISVLGGNAVLASYFASDVNLVYAVKGHELKTYGQGSKSYEYQHLCAPPPLLDPGWADSRSRARCLQAAPPAEWRLRWSGRSCRASGSHTSSAQPGSGRAARAAAPAGNGCNASPLWNLAPRPLLKQPCAGTQG